MNTELNKDELIEWRRVLTGKINISCIMYVDAILFDSNYEKGKAHWDIMEHLCEYVTGNTFEDDQSLYLCLHDKSQKITDNLDEHVGLKLYNTYRERSKMEMDGYGRKLCEKLIMMVEPLVRNCGTFSRHVTPTKLTTPSRRMTR